MATVKTSDLVIKAMQGTGATIAGFNSAVTLTSAEAKVLIDPVKQLTSIVETTGVGVGRRQRRDAGLKDLGGITISGLLDPVDADGLYELLRLAYDGGLPFSLEVEYASGKSIKADWLVESLETDHTVGDFVMVKGSIVATGKGYANTLT